MLRKRVKEQDKEIRRLKEENEFLGGKPALFSPPAVGSQQKPENDLSRLLKTEDGRITGKISFYCRDAWYQPAGLL